MAEHPIQGLMQTAMENLRDMVDVNTIIGEPVEAPGGQVIIPVSKLGFGFAAGGSEFSGGSQNKNPDTVRGQGDSERNGSGQSKGQKSYPFGGGSGGGVSITPVAFIVVGEKDIRLLSLEGTTHLYNRLIDSAANLLDKVGGGQKKKEEKPEREPGCH
ncbi:GerW family sporulation protein [Thermoflavimicrobium dichotomicum]|uniref:Sporulation protein YtfJ n=1 Tax=Thermoflavimicrobium dichotomicum TaxID=46223 RepID=A0A1I3TXV6_9BACL|nr:GerW family sporulation protein [Thermoflavimicrobium dichotomicum]SFJ75303.1 sporulation protein YtfJ [Thermoflavimicrobium dichotomicum]